MPAPGAADPAATLPYYGYLAEPAGNPVADGPYDLLFRISATSSVISTAVWSETHPAVPVVDGRFQVVLGSILPLPLDFDDDWYLWMVVDGTQTMLPKQILGMSPHARTLCLPYSGSVSSSTDAFSVGNSGSGAAIHAEGDLEVGTPTRTGVTNLHQSGASSLIGEITTYSNLGGRIIARQEDGLGGGELLVHGPGPGSEVGLWSNPDGVAYLTMGSGNNSFLGLLGADRDLVVAMAATGSDQVQLPASALDALETFDEPGCAGNFVNATQTVNSTVGVVASQSLVVPRSGYVMAFGTLTVQNLTSWFGFYGVSASPTTFPANQQVAIFLSSVDYQIPLTVTGLFPVTAGAHTFYLLGQSFGNGTTQQAEKAQLTLLYLPSAYGTIQATATAPPEFELENGGIPIGPAGGGDQ